MKKTSKYKSDWYYFSVTKKNWKILQKEGVPFGIEAEFCDYDRGYHAYLIGCKLKKEATTLALWAGTWLMWYVSRQPIVSINLEYKL